MTIPPARSALLLLCLAAPPAAAQHAGPVREISTGSQDRVLRWSVRERGRVGGGSPGGDFFRVFPWTVAADRRGRIHVLDVGDFRVAVFDSAGRHLRDLGRKGGGPGEFLQPAGLSAGSDGAILVLDAGKGAIVRFDSAGRVLEQVRLDGRATAVAAGNGEIFIGLGASALEHTTLVSFGDTVRQVLADVEQSPRQVRFPGCPVSVPAQPLFGPEVVWASSFGTTVANDTDAYRLQVWRGGMRQMVVTRDVRPIEITRAEALKSPAVRNGFAVNWPGGSCRVSPEDLLDARGYATRMSPVERIAVTPDGGFWVRRRTGVEPGFRLDVFDPAGRYLGTLPAGFPFPTAFLGPSRLVVLRYDRDGVPELVLYDLSRSE